MQDFRRGRHSVSLLTVHLVCVTKYRRRIFDSAALNWLAEHFRKVCETVDCRLIASDGEADHVHMLVEYPPKVSVSALVNILKGTSSRMLRQARPDIARRYSKGTLWSPSYFAASTGGATLETIKRYVEAQRSAPPRRPKARGFRRGKSDDCAWTGRNSYRIRSAASICS